MFQTFDTSAASAKPDGTRILALKRELATLGLHALLVPHEDEYQGEYIPPCAERLHWLTGFSGSAGMAVIAAEKAALFVDGRYVLQAGSQVDLTQLEIHEVPKARASAWMLETLPEGAIVGFDPWLHTWSNIAALQKALAPRKIQLKSLSKNPIDKLWGRARPAAPRGAVHIHPLSHAGEPSSAKIMTVQAALVADRQDWVVLKRTDSICWLLNIRGSDIAHTPIVLARALLPAHGKPRLFIEAKKLAPDVLAYLSEHAVVEEPRAFLKALAALKAEGKAVRLDANSTNYAVGKALGGDAKFTAAPDPCQKLKAIKNSAEIAGARAAHARDGAAMVRFLAWLDEHALKESIDEITAVKKLEGFRAQTALLKDLSFDTISGSGPNGAIVHYRVTTATNRELKSGELFLIDSGAQYVDGTTDITRTVAIGPPTDEMRTRATLVLKAHIAIATSRFPKGTRGVELDALARSPLWQAGLDYDHGTGHGVGSYLSVHEGPQSISRGGMEPLEPHMICSNEPGCYKTGVYGIRIENLVLVTPLAPIPGGEREMMAFETLTLAPFDRRLIDASLLTPPERAWVDAYHVRVAQVLGPHVHGSDLAWLQQATAAL